MNPAATRDVGRAGSVVALAVWWNGGATVTAPSSPSFPLSVHPVLLFDGVCNLCNGTVQWILARDRRQVFRFASLQSPAARRLLDSVAAPADLPDSVVLIDGGRVLVRSDAAIAVARRLGFPWSMAAVGRAVPRVLRDAVYSWVARHRYRWFGRRATCWVPTPELSARFLDAVGSASRGTDSDRPPGSTRR